MRVDVIKSSLRPSVEKTRFSTWDLVRDSTLIRHSAASEILVALANWVIGQSQLYINFISFIFPHLRETWENRYCHDVSEIEDVNQCDLYPANTDTNGSPMKCCSAENRSTCRRHNTIVTGPAR